MEKLPKSLKHRNSGESGRYSGAQEAGEVVGQGVGQGVVIHGRDAHGVEVQRLIGAGSAVRGGHGDQTAGVGSVGGAVVVHNAGVGVVQVDVVVVVVIGTGDVGGDQTDVGGCVVRGQNILQGVHKVLCGDGGHDFAVVVHPVLLPQMEGPGQGVRIPVPAGGQTFAHDALVVVLDQRIHAVGTHDHFQIGGGGQVVQGGGLAGVQDGVLGGVHRAGSRAAGAAGRGAAAAAGQQTGCMSVSRGYTPEKIGRIMSSQLSEKEFRKHCDFVIDNSDSLEDSYRQIRQKLEAYTWRE